MISRNSNKRAKIANDIEEKISTEAEVKEERKEYDGFFSVHHNIIDEVNLLNQKKDEEVEAEMTEACKQIAVTTENKNEMRENLELKCDEEEEERDFLQATEEQGDIGVSKALPRSGKFLNVPLVSKTCSSSTGDSILCCGHPPMRERNCAKQDLEEDEDRRAAEVSEERQRNQEKNTHQDVSKQEVTFFADASCTEKLFLDAKGDCTIATKDYFSAEDSVHDENLYDDLSTDHELEKLFLPQHSQPNLAKKRSFAIKNQKTCQFASKKNKSKLSLKDIVLLTGHEPPPHIFNDNLEISCYKCKQVSTEEELGKMLVCEGYCQHIFHAKCVDMSESIQQSTYQTNRWKCADCRDGLLNCKYCNRSYSRRLLSKCSHPLCRNFYCYPSCVNRLRVVAGGEKVMKLLCAVYRHAEGLYDDKGRKRFICPSHICWSCYDSGKYRYVWESKWRKMVESPHNLWHRRVYLALQKSTRGMLEARYFHKQTRLPRFPQLPNILSVMCSLEKCIRCSRAWCKKCWHPDSILLVTSTGAAVCHHCFHEEQNKLLISQFPTVNLLSETPEDLFREIQNLLCTPGASYRVETGMQTIDCERNWYSFDGDFTEVKFACEAENVERKRKRKRRISKNDNDNVDKSTLDFTHISSNFINSKYYNLLKASDRTQGAICSCVDRCSSTCENRMSHVQCNVKNCIFGMQDCGNRPFSRSQTHNLKLRKTDNRGIGLFATSDFVSGNLIIEYVGEVIPEDIHKARCNQRAFDELQFKKKCHWYVLEASRGVYIDSTFMGNTSRFANHSCDPNAESFCFVVNGLYRVGIFAKRSIKAGEEITYDYRFDSTGVGSGFECKCGSANCRGTVGLTSERLQLVEIENMINIQDDPRGAFEELASALINKNYVDPYILRVSQCNPIMILEKNKKQVSRELCNADNDDRKDEEAWYENLQNAAKVRCKKDDVLNLLLDNDTHKNNATRNYVRALALNNKTVEQWNNALTKKFGMDIPWTLFVNQLNSPQLEATRECCMMFNEMYVRCRRYLTRQVLLLIKNRHGRKVFDTMQSILDHTWGSTEVCVACGCPGLVQMCDFCAETFHVDEQCCDWLETPDGDIVCEICGNDDHRSRWWSLSEVEREELSDLAYKERTEMFLKEWESSWIPSPGDVLPDVYRTTLYSSHTLSSILQQDGNFNRIFFEPQNFSCGPENAEFVSTNGDWELPWSFQ